MNLVKSEEAGRAVKVHIERIDRRKPQHEHLHADEVGEGWFSDQRQSLYFDRRNVWPHKPKQQACGIHRSDGVARCNLLLAMGLIRLRPPLVSTLSQSLIQVS